MPCTSSCSLPKLTVWITCFRTNSCLCALYQWSVVWKYRIVGAFEGENFREFKILQLFVKFSPWNLGVWHLLAARMSNLQKFPPQKFPATMSTKHLPPSLPSLSPQCCLHLQQTTGSCLRDVRRWERSSGHCPCHHNCSAGGTPAGNRDHSGSGPRNNPHQLPWRETTCAPTRLIPSWRSRPNLCCLQLVANTTENCFCYNILTTRVPPQLI